MTRVKKEEGEEEKVKKVERKRRKIRPPGQSSRNCRKTMRGMRLSHRGDNGVSKSVRKRRKSVRLDGPTENACFSAHLGREARGDTPEHDFKAVCYFFGPDLEWQRGAGTLRWPPDDVNGANDWIRVAVCIPLMLRSPRNATRHAPSTSDATTRLQRPAQTTSIRIPAWPSAPTPACSTSGSHEAPHVPMRRRRTFQLCMFYTSSHGQVYFISYLLYQVCLQRAAEPSSRDEFKPLQIYILRQGSKAFP
ncbi:uncharacterized protein LOC128504305 [Spea bombifrons]|uniref:uncharacterized protein LOC128504305 n=1 Tax=Spea bombifrons TaxID=233779 RepID=UPI0023492C64|nr:uncharacterized protein LOC128504305 [Spea bombifrons]